MVSARVLNPVVISEFCKMGTSPTMSRNLPCGSQLNRIKRNLFGTATPSPLAAETTRHFNKDLEKHQDQATKKWGFDFRAGCPLGSNGSFIWERVSFQESTFAPEMYTLTRAAHVRPTVSGVSDMDTLLNERADRENSGANLTSSSLESTTDNESCYDSQDESLHMRFTRRQSAGTSTSSSYSTIAASPRKRQLKITEFMKERKRLPQAPKKISPAAKRLRTSSGSSSSHQNSLSTHLSGFLKRARHH